MKEILTKNKIKYLFILKVRKSFVYIFENIFSSSINKEINDAQSEMGSKKTDLRAYRDLTRPAIQLYFPPTLTFAYTSVENPLFCL